MTIRKYILGIDQSKTSSGLAMLCMDVEDDGSCLGQTEISCPAQPFYLECWKGRSSHKLKYVDETLRKGLPNEHATNVMHIERCVEDVFEELMHKGISLDDVVVSLEHPLFGGSYSEGQFHVFHSILRHLMIRQVDVFCFSIHMVKKYLREHIKAFHPLDKPASHPTKSDLTAYWLDLKKAGHLITTAKNSDERDAQTLAFLAMQGLAWYHSKTGEHRTLNQILEFFSDTSKVEVQMCQEDIKSFFNECGKDPHYPDLLEPLFLRDAVEKANKAILKAHLKNGSFTTKSKMFYFNRAAKRVYERLRLAPDIREYRKYLTPEAFNILTEKMAAPEHRHVRTYMMGAGLHVVPYRPVLPLIE